MKTRRIVAALLIVLGAVTLLAAPETLGGVLAIAAGIIIEVVGSWRNADRGVDQTEVPADAQRPRSGRRQTATFKPARRGFQLPIAVSG